MRKLEGEIVDSQLKETLESMHLSTISDESSQLLFPIPVTRKVYLLKVNDEYRAAITFADAPNIPKGTRVTIEEQGKILKKYFLKTDEQKIPLIYFL